MRTLIIATLFFAGTTATTRADVNVITDIAPVQAIVAEIMKGIGVPQVMVDINASPHDFALRPSQAQSLSQADLVIWTGHDLTPWLEAPIETLAQEASVIELLEMPGTIQRASSEEAHDDQHEEGHHDDHDGHADGHEDGHHEDHKGEHEEGHHDEHEQGHKEELGDHHGHDHSGDDPHAWLDPQNAAIWAPSIAAELGRLDPENADTYALNAIRFVQEMQELTADISTQLSGLSAQGFVVFHDAYRHFEDRFGLENAGTIALSDAFSPSPARIFEIRETLERLGEVCVFAEPQFPSPLINTVTEGLAAKSAILDPLGSTLPQGPSFYKSLIQQMADAFESCL